ncbi:hypothetical protein T4D_9442 [Trichinella pseudospiralis]|uniref:Uncharacterized protein n=1 Tax=Trichinella pseudospiralis TaxID=6337 RepID=A0A0V1F342_TRIPS|nr:hypothetical protein T4D_9442 [Trichinella pseudospiralis]
MAPSEESHRPPLETVALGVHRDNESAWEVAEDPRTTESRRHRARRRPWHMEEPLAAGTHRRNLHRRRRARSLSKRENGDRNNTQISLDACSVGTCRSLLMGSTH